MAGSEFNLSGVSRLEKLGGTSDALALPGEKFRRGEGTAEATTGVAMTLDPADKARFVEEWNLRDGELTDEQILLAIHLGHL